MPRSTWVAGVVASLVVMLMTAGSVPAQERGQASIGISESERQALISLYQATGGDRWINHDGWLGPAGTECGWHGVECWSQLNPKPQQVTGLNLIENNLVGSIPENLGQLTHLEDLTLVGNHLSGQLPAPLIQLWLAGSLQVGAEASLLTDISKIEYEVDPSALLCGFRRIDLDADGRAIRYETRCRNATPDDRTIYCEVKEGKSWGAGFAELAWVLEKNGFFHLNPEYSGNMTDAAFVTTRATRNGKQYSVEEYAFGAPFELHVIHLAIDGFASSRVEWETTSTRAECPASMVKQK